jgi:hypothetical protein
MRRFFYLFSEQVVVGRRKRNMNAQDLRGGKKKGGKNCVANWPGDAIRSRKYTKLSKWKRC